MVVHRNDALLLGEPDKSILYQPSARIEIERPTIQGVCEASLAVTYLHHPELVR